MRDMKRFSKAARVLVVVGMIVAGVVAQAKAAPIVSIAPASQTAAITDSVAVNIIVTGLTEPVGGYYLYLLFDDTILSGDTYTNDPGGALGPAPDDFSLGFGAGDLELFFVADLSWDAVDLATAQGTGFVLATLSFTALANGVSPISLQFVDLSDALGESLLGRSTRDGQVCVGGPCPVPEPGSTLLLLAGFASLAVGRRVARRRV